MEIGVPSFPAEDADVDHAAAGKLEAAVAPSRQAVQSELKRKQVEAGFAEDFDAAVPERVANLRPGAEVFEPVKRPELESGGGSDDGLPNAVGGADGEEAARFEDAGHLAQGLQRIGGVFDALGGDDGVEALRAEDVDQHQTIRLDAAAAGPIDCAADKVLAEVTGGDVRAAGGKLLAEVTQPAADVEDGLPRQVVGREEFVDQDFEASLSVVLGEGGLEAVSQSFVAEFSLADGAHAGSWRKLD